MQQFELQGFGPDSRKSGTGFGICVRYDSDEIMKVKLVV